MGVKLNGWLQAVHVVTTIAIVAKQQLEGGRGGKEEKSEIKREDASSTWSYTVVVVAKQQLEKREENEIKGVVQISTSGYYDRNRRKTATGGGGINFWHDVKGAVDKVSKIFDECSISLLRSNFNDWRFKSGFKTVQ